MIVAGGINFSTYLDSVEVLEGVDGSWRFLEAKLPRVMIRGITLNNVIYMIGEYQFNINLSIYQFINSIQMTIHPLRIRRWIITFLFIA